MFYKTKKTRTQKKIQHWIVDKISYKYRMKMSLNCVENWKANVDTVFIDRNVCLVRLYTQWNNVLSESHVSVLKSMKLSVENCTIYQCKIKNDWSTLPFSTRVQFVCVSIRKYIVNTHHYIVTYYDTRQWTSTVM